MGLPDHGQPPVWSGVPVTVRLYDRHGELVGLVTWHTEREHERSVRNIIRHGWSYAALGVEDSARLAVTDTESE